jgi:polar amino acid transport system substrate-binding protein
MMRAAILTAIGALLLACTSTTTPPVTESPTPPASAQPPSPPSPTAVITPEPSQSPTAARTTLLTTVPPATPVPTMPSSADLQAELVAPDTLTACLAVVGAPATALNVDGMLEGYNVSFAQELANRLGLELLTREPLFDDLITTVQGHQCDLSISSQNITTGRLELVDFIAYTESIQPVLVAANNPEHIGSLADLCGKRVSAASGTTHVDLVNGTGDFAGQGLNQDCATVGEAPITLKTYETDSGAVTALLSGDVDAYLGNPNFAAEFPGQIEESDATLPPARQGITTAKDRQAVHAAIAATMSAMMADGTYRAILVQNLPNDESVQLVSILE